MRTLVYIGLGIAGFLLQSGVLSQFHILNVEIDLVTPMIAVVGLMGGMLPAMFLGLGIGLSMDVLFSGTIGFYALPLMAVGVLTGLIKESRFSVMPLMPALLGAGAILIKELLSLLLAYALLLSFSASYIFITKVLPGMLMGAILGSLIYIALMRLFKLRFMRPRKSLDL